MTKEEFEEDIKIGEIWKFRTKDEDFIGKVDSFGPSGIKVIRIDTNTPKRISYELILDYEPDNSKRQENVVDELKTDSDEDNRSSTPLEVLNVINDFIKSENDNTSIMDFDSVFKYVNTQISNEYKKETSKIKSKLLDAKKNHEDDFESTKIKQIFNEIDILIKNGIKEASLLKAILFFNYKKEESIDCFMQGNAFNYAFYAAIEFDYPEKKLQAALLSFIKKQADKTILNYLIEYSKQDKDQLILRYMIDNDTENKLVLLFIYFENTIVISKLPKLNDVVCNENLLYLENEYAKIGKLDYSKVSEYINEYINITKSEDSSDNQSSENLNIRTGYITTYNQEKLYGFIGDVFFHMRQVSDDDLQKILFNEGLSRKRKLFVSYHLGRTPQGKIAADDVRLIKRQEEDNTENKALIGKIRDYELFEYFGIIEYMTKTYRFNFNEVKDIVLAKILDNKLEKLPIEVLFDLRNIKGKNVAVNVRCIKDIPQEKIDYLLDKKYITRDEINRRNQYFREEFTPEGSFSLEYVPLIPIENYVSEDGSDTNVVDNFYFEMARQADQYEKNLDKAILNYKKAIELGQNLSGSILNLALIYSRLDKIEDALQLLDDYKSELDYSRYLNTKVQVLQKNIEKKYAPELIYCLNEIVKISSSEDKRLQTKMNIARVYLQIEDYTNSEKLFNELLSNKNIDIQQKRYVLISLCNIKIKTKNISQAVDYAKRILNDFPEDNYALSVVNNPELLEDDIIDDFIDYNSGSEISDFIINRINQLSLITELKKQDSKKINDDNIFVGSEKDAETLMINLTKQETGNDGVKANQRFARAKIIHQIMERENFKGESKYITKNEYLSNVAYGTLYFGNHRLYNISFDLTKNLDSARYLYLESAKILKDSEKMHPCWYLAVLSFFKTYFTEDEVEIKRIPMLKDTQNSNEDFSIALMDILHGNLKTPIKVFVAGIFECIEYEDRNRKLIISCIEKSHLKSQIEKELCNFYGKNVNDSFYTLMTEALKKYISLRASFLRDVSNTINNIFSYGFLSDRLDRINESKFLEYLNPTDDLAWKKLLSIFTRIIKYNEAYDFDYKADMLTSANEDRDLLEEQINKNPTRFGYDLLLNKENDLQVKIYKESQSIYESSMPEIDIQIVEDSITVNQDQKNVSFAVNFVNKENVQNADNVSITVQSQKAKNLNNDELSRLLIKGDGKPIQKLFKFELDEELLKEKVLPITITISYQYKKKMDDCLTYQNSFEKSVPLIREKFEPIENKFAKYRDGSPVRDEEMFFGRENDINKIINQVCDADGKVHSGKSLALYGQTRTGKSSLLYHVEKRLREKSPERNIIINIGSIGELDLTSGLYEFLYAVLDQLKTELSHNHKNLLDRLLSEGIKIDPDLLEEDKVQLQFNKMFKDLCRFIEENDTKHNIILMIDEFTYIYDWIRQGSMTDRFMKFWKGFVQNNGIYAIIIGQDHMMQFVDDNRFTNDFGSTEQQKVTYLSEENAKELMTKPILMKTDNGYESRYKEGALEKLYELTSGSAFLIMKLCAGLVDYINDVIKNPYITIAYIDEYLKNNLATFEESKYFEPQYSDKSSMNADEVVEKNKNLLKKIAQVSPRKEWSPIEKVIENSEDMELLKNLEKRDVVLIEEGQRCKIKVQLYKEWILAKYGEKL